MTWNPFRAVRTLLTAMALAVCAPTQAAFHLWSINEIYSNADGSVQFIELTALTGGQQFLVNQNITSSAPGQPTREFVFPSNLPGDSLNRTFLIGTQGFAALGIVTPDYVVPNGFLYLTNGTINFAGGSDLVSYAALPTTGGQSINRNGTAGANSPRNFAGATGVVTAGPLNYSDLWWVGESENGWGMSIQQHGNVQFNALYVYDNTGAAKWYVMPGGTWNANFTQLTGPIYQPTSSPLNNYNPAQFVVGNPAGTATLTFTSASTLTLQYTIGAATGTKSMQRQVFGTGTSPIQVGDMWWGGPTQDGWGITLVQQAGIVFAVWYTYGLDGRATWFVVPTGTWSGLTYSGRMYATNGPSWLGVPYNPALLMVTDVGSISFAFSNANAATMTYTFTAGPFSGLTQSKSLVRQPY